MANAHKSSENLDHLGETFLGILMSDVIAADAQISMDGDQAPMRDFIRTSFAAIEGLVWNYREQIVSAADTLDELTPELELVFAEVSYVVTETGKIIRQPKHVPLTHMVRLATNLAKTLCPNLETNFDREGWASLKRAIKVRNRLTHPKSKADLIVTAGDVAVCWSALLWLAEFTTEVLAAAARRQSDYVKFLRGFVADLKSGHPAALRLYEEAKTHR